MLKEKPMDVIWAEKHQPVLKQITTTASRQILTYNRSIWWILLIITFFIRYVFILLSLSIFFIF